MEPDDKASLLKHKSKSKKLGDGNIDNTAPVTKIAKDLYYNNSKAYKVCRESVGTVFRDKHNISHYLLNGHAIYAFNKEWDGELNTGYFEQFMYKSLFPQIISPIQNIDKSDPVTEVMIAKKKWHDLNKHYKSMCLTNEVKNYKRIDNEVLWCSKFMVEWAEHYHQNPDPYFDSNHNWYYTGHGNLQHISFEGNDYLVHSELNCLSLTPFNIKSFVLDWDNRTTFKCEEGENIMETIHSVENIVALRTKYKIYLLKIISYETVKLENFKVIQSDVPYCSISFDTYHKNILYLNSIDNKLKIVNLDRMTGRTLDLTGKSNFLNNWQSVRSSERGTFTHISKRMIINYDKRTNKPSAVWKDSRTLAPDQSCNDIRIAKYKTENSSQIYVGSEHHLFLLDMRAPQKAMMRWTHGMMNGPSYISLCRFEFNKELVCIGGQWVEDTCVVQNFSNVIPDSELPGISMPYRPPSILGTLEEARKKLICYASSKSIDKRLTTALTGNIIMEYDEKYAILSQNSLGDITLHTMHPEPCDLSIIDDGPENLQQWIENCKVPTEQFTVSKLVDFSKVLQSMKSIPDDYPLEIINKPIRVMYSKQEIIDAFENEEIDPALWDAWKETEIEDKQEHAFVIQFEDSDN